MYYQRIIFYFNCDPLEINTNNKREIFNMLSRYVLLPFYPLHAYSFDECSEHASYGCFLINTNIFHEIDTSQLESNLAE
jgi:hypothetical protein